ncbi:uncharacterized protein LOC130701310 [Daphnia carinata]|uniref:uncharacterized protein LOC130701310 n=1 Tax=Daphnia carinata TaxID=120202 RepID=UPI002580A88F|nr:uncharacterized protein LOC130701310 [Daphnia carinata]
MSDSAGMNEHDLFEGCESKSSSQESGLCSTMIAIDESMGSLEEISDNLHQHLNTHLDHTSVLQYELDTVRAQLAEKNRLISTQQVTIKQLQDALKANQKELEDLKRTSEVEITCKNETIDILQTDLIDCQQQYANCIQQIMNQNRVLSEIRDDDAVLVEKIAQLEKKLRKNGKTTATQTDIPQSCGDKNDRQTHCSFKSSPPPFSPPPPFHHHCRSVNTQPSLGDAIDGRADSCSPHFTHHKSAQSKSQSAQQGWYVESKPDSQQFPWSQFQDLLSEVRQIQKPLQSTDERSGRDTATVHPRNGNVIRADDLTGFWNTIAEERQQRLQLDHSLRQMELDVLEVKTQVQSCKARFQNYQPSAPPHWNCCPPKFCCSPTHEMVKHCSCVDEIPVPHPKLRSSTSLFTLV